MPPAFEVLLLNTAIPQIQAAQSGDTYVVPRDIAFSAALTLSAGTANGVPYLNASKVLTTGSALTFDGTKLGVGVASAQAGVDIANSGLWSSGNIYNYPAGNAFVKIQGVAAQNNWIGIAGSYGQTTGSANLLLQANFNNTTQQAGHYIGSEAQSATSSDLTFGSITGGVTTGTNATKNELMRLTSTGLGIGTNNPTQKLTVNGVVASIGPATALTASSAFFDYNSTLNLGRFAAVGNTTGTAAPIYFSQYSSNASVGRDAMIIDSSGNLGLGVTPSAWSGYTALQVGSGFTAWSSGVANARINANTYYNGGYKYVGTGTATMYEQDGYHAWYTAVSGTAGNAIAFTQAMTLDASGNLAIGDSTISGYRFNVKSADDTASTFAAFFRNSSSTNLLVVRSDGYFSTGTAANSPYNSTTASAANVVVDSGGQLFRSTSSLKYKRDVQDAKHGLAEVMGLRPVTYKGKNDGDTVFGGLIAEEVHAAGLTEFVQYAEDGSPDALAYSNMVSLLVKAIQEQQAMINELKAEVAALKGA